MYGITKYKMTLEEKIIFIFGFTATMPILQIKGISLFTFFALGMTVYFAIKIYLEKKNPFSKIANMWYVFIVITGIISAVICLLSDMQQYWKSNQYTNILWLGIFLIILIYFNRKEGVSSALVFLNGVYWAAIFQVVWALLQYVIYKVCGISTNTVMFTEVLQVIEYATHTKYNGSIALSGFCWHVGNMTPLVTFGYVFSQSRIVKLMIIAYAMVCNSRTTLLGILFCVFLELVYYFKKKRNIHKSVIVCGTLLVAIAGVIVFYDKLLYVLQEVVSKLGQGGVDTSALTHLNYWTSLPFFFSRLDIKNLMFGFGLENSGYPFAKEFLQYVGEVWIVECDYINQLWNTGLVGLLLVYGWIGYLYMSSRKKSFKYSIFILALLFEGITYNVIFKWCWVVLFAVYSVSNYYETESKRCEEAKYQL